MELGFNDYEIRKVLFVERNLRVEFVLQDCPDKIIICENFEFFHLNSDYFQNIVSEAYLFSKEEILNLHDEFIFPRYKYQIGKISHGFQIFLLEPVVGLELFCSCDRVIIL